MIFLVAWLAGVVILLAAVVVWLIGRVLEHQRRLEELAGLPQRIWNLEKFRVPGAPQAAAPSPAPIVREPPQREFVPPAPCPPPCPAAPLHESPREEAAPPEPPVAAVPAGPDWETRVGGSWLNKIGAVVLVIGVALFLAYSAAHLEALGRVILSLAVSLALLGVGFVLERQPRFTNYARGLLGGGWAALYCTVYAMHALEAARIVHDPLLATLLLFTVAGAMVLHSLRYRSEVVTGIAYFAAFASLAVTPTTAFSVFALAPLAVSLLCLSFRHGWFRMALFGLVATYGTAATRSMPDAPLWSTQAILAIYWSLFEAFDLLRAWKRQPASGSLKWLFPVNAAGALTLSWAKWSQSAPDDLHLLFAGAAIAYLAMTFARAWPRPHARYEKPVTLSAALALVWIFLKLHGYWVNTAILAEAELLFLAGWLLRERYLCLLAWPVFGVSLARLALKNIGADSEYVFAGHPFHEWTPTALLTAGLFFVNRALRRPGLAFSYLATTLLAVIVGFEARAEYLGVAWLAAGCAFFELGIWEKLREFRIQGYTLGILGTALLSFHETLGVGAEHHAPWIPLFWATLLVYGVSGQLSSSAPERIPDAERRPCRDTAFAVAALLLAGMIWRLLPTPLIAVGWAMECVVLVALGLLWKLKMPRWTGYAAALLAFGRVGLANLDLTENLWGMPARILTVSAVTALFYLCEFALPRAGGALSAIESRWRPALSWLASLMLTALLYREVSGRMLTVGWGIEGAALLAAGFPLRERALRLAGLSLFLACLVKVFFYDLANLDTVYRILSFVVLGLLLLAVSWIYTRHGGWVSAMVRGPAIPEGEREPR